LPDFSNGLNNLSSETLNSSHGLPPLNLDSTATNLDSNMSQFPPLDLAMLSRLNGTSTSNESEEAEEKPKKPDRFSRMEEAFNEQFVGIGVLVAQFHEADGLVLINRADPLSKRLVGVARQNPAVYKALKKYIDGSVWMMLTEEVATIGLAIMANHGINPVGSLIEKFKGKKDAGNDQLSAVA